MCSIIFASFDADVHAQFKLLGSVAGFDVYDYLSLVKRCQYFIVETKFSVFFIALMHVFNFDYT